MLMTVINLLEKTMNTHPRLIAIGLALTLAGCNSGNTVPRLPDAGPDAGGSPLPPPPVVTTDPGIPYSPCADMPAAAEPSLAGPDALPGGIWWGTLTNDTQMTTRAFDAMVTEDGRFRMLASNSGATLSTMNAQLTGSVAVLGNTLAGGGAAYLGPGDTNYDNTYTGDVTVSGIVVERDRLTAEWTAASGDSGCVEAIYDVLSYEQTLPVASLQGVWGDAGNRVPIGLLTFDANGTFSGQGEGGCAAIGSIAPIDEAYGLYEIRQTISGCAIAGDYTGLAYLCPCGMPGWYLVMSIDNGTRAFRWFFSA